MCSPVADCSASVVGMSIHLVGGGRDEERCAAVLAPFVMEARDAAASAGLVIALLLVLEPDDDETIARFTSVLVAAGASADEIRIVAIVEGDRFAVDAVEDAHGLFVGGGLTPAYHDAFVDIGDAVRQRVAAGASYAGFSAGAAIAATAALVGGYRLGDVEVAPEETGEELDGLEVRPGLGLVDLTVDVHAAQWGTIARLLSAVEAGLTARGAAIDEHTALVVDDAGERIRGDGRVWWVESQASGVSVTTRASS